MKPLILIAGTMDVHRRYYELVQKSGMNAQMLSYRAGEAFPYSTLQNLSFDLLLLPGCTRLTTYQQQAEEDRKKRCYTFSKFPFILCQKTYLRITTFIITHAS